MVLINHLTNFWPQTASDKNLNVFGSIFVKILKNSPFDYRQYDSKFARNDSWLNTIKICLILQDFSSLLKSECLSFSSILSNSIAYRKTAKAWNIVEIIRQAVESYRLGIKSKFIKIWTLNFDTFHLRLLRMSEVKRVSNGYSVINFYYYWLSQVNQKTNNSESKSHNHFKTWGFELKHPV